MDRDRAMHQVEHHQRSRWWQLVGFSRCARCRHRWPCPPYLDARTRLLGTDRRDVTTAVLRYRNQRP